MGAFRRVPGFPTSENEAELSEKKQLAGRGCLYVCETLMVLVGGWTLYVMWQAS